MDVTNDESNDIFIPMKIWLIKGQKPLVNTFREKWAYY